VSVLNSHGPFGELACFIPSRARWIWNHSPNLFGLGTTDVESNSMSDIDITQEKTTTRPYRKKCP
jgi:hypothetical protein